MNTPVNFELAKLLKEKGFDNESAHYYDEKGKMLFDVNFPSLQPTKPNIYYDNPTIAEVRMWLYEKHNIWLEVHKNWKTKNEIFFYYSFGSYNSLNLKDNKGQYSLPTEAYEAAIEYILKNLR